MTGFNWHNPYPTTRIPVFARNVVSTSHRSPRRRVADAVEGRQRGRRGAGRRGRDHGRRVCSAAMRSRSCGRRAAVRAERVGRRAGRMERRLFPQAPRRGGQRHREQADARLGHRHRAGRDRGLGSAASKFGSLPFADLLEPAIEIAERGYAVPPIVAHKWAAAVPELKGLPGFADTFMPHGRAPQVGERVCLPGHAQTLRTLQKEGARAFYEGRSPSASPRSPAKAGRAGRSRPAGLPARMGRADRQALRPSHDPRDSAERAGHRRADRARDCRARGRDRVASRFGRLAASADRGDEARVRRCLSLRRRSARDGLTPEQMLDDAYLAERAKLIDPRARRTSPPAGRIRAARSTCRRPTSAG